MELIFGAGDVSAVVQAACAMLGLIVAFVTLVILFFYARDTKTLANAAGEQIEESGIPYLTILTPGKANPWYPISFVIMNQGRGPALNVILKTRVAQRRATVQIGPSSCEEKWTDWQATAFSVDDLGVGEDTPIFQDVQRAIYESEKIVLEYQSLGQRNYRSHYARSKEGPVSRRFERLGRRLT
jgi:hypothetical protein